MFGALACAIRVRLRKRLSSQNFNSHRVRATCSACLAVFCPSCFSFDAEHSKLPRRKVQTDFARVHRNVAENLYTPQKSALRL